MTLPVKTILVMESKSINWPSRAHPSIYTDVYRKSQLHQIPSPSPPGEEHKYHLYSEE
jgi:hypothetical protein